MKGGDFFQILSKKRTPDSGGTGNQKKRKEFRAPVVNVPGGRMVTQSPKRHQAINPAPEKSLL